MDKTFKIVLLLLAISLIAFLVMGCSKQAAKTDSDKSGGYQKITASAVKSRLDKGEQLIIVDVRTKEEYDDGHIPKSLLIPYDEIEVKAASLLPDKNAAIIVYCRTGRRSEIAAKSLLKLGYTNVADMGAISDWKYGLEK
ncbi:Thiosulfate sulfurtransferase GlpE [bioreactor metagenome]|uniref:Thiosulfate sulfurtransferase GlpE n=1 Tax=bioreactor metagenome TaxID=1076179 RepID=A0A645BYG2_9ZZZZ